MEEYKIHDNGGRPFKVHVNKNHVQIFAKKKKRDSYKFKPFYDKKVEQVFVGLSPLNAMTQFSGGHGPRFDGNSLLLHKNKLTYVFVGESVFKFRALAPIVSYVSPVGNNDVPYPYAVDSKNNYYLLVEGMIINIPVLADMDDPYDYYYNADLITDDIGRDPPKKPPLGYIRNIREFWQEYWDYGDNNQLHNYGNQQWTLRFRSDYKKRAHELKNAYIVYENGTKQDLDPETYIAIMKEAKARMGVVGSIEGKPIHKRIW